MMRRSSAGAGGRPAPANDRVGGSRNFETNLEQGPHGSHVFVDESAARSGFRP
jgi:hypothetical protein